MSLSRRPLAAAVAVVVTLGLTVAAAAPASAAAGYERILNGTFSEGVRTPWFTSNAPPTVTDGKLCAQVPGGTTQPFNALIGQNDILLQAGKLHTVRFDVSASRAVTVRAIAQLAVAPFSSAMNRPVAVTTAPQTFEFTFTPSFTDARGQFAFQLGGHAEGFNICVDNISLVSPPRETTGYERVLNGTFDNGLKSPWWTSGNSPSAVTGGRLCAQIPGGTTQVWNSMIGQNDIPLEAGKQYTMRFEVSASRAVTIRAVVALGVTPGTGAMNKAVPVTTTPTGFEFSFTPSFTDIHGQFSFQLGGHAEGFEACVDNISMIGGFYAPGAAPRDFGTPVRVNMHGYVTDGPKRATVVTAGTEPQAWRLLDASGVVAAEGTTVVYGDDAMSGEHVHTVDFSDVTTEGTGYTLVVGSATSESFDIGSDLYAEFRHDALAYFYHSRSGIEIEAQYVGAEYARAAGHVGVAPNQGDISVPCLPGTCDYSLDVSGGWYDAGDHGKYVVNGGIAAWQLLDQYERSARIGDEPGAGDGALSIPEAGNGMPDVLDEARWQIDFLLRMQVPTGQPLAGMVHHKIHDLRWTGHPLAPAADPQPRYLYPPSTAATLNVAAVGARCGRVYFHVDREFARRCLEVAESAWAAALAHPVEYAPPGGEGGGPYADTNVSDEFSWAAAELFATTHRPEFKGRINTVLTTDGFYWGGTGGLADLALVPVLQRLSGPERAALTSRIVAVADEFMADMQSQGYANPYLPTDGKYVWGSSSSTTNNMMIIAIAGDLTGEQRYRDAVVESMDYLLGRNAMNYSYVTGYGERHAHNQHHRFWAHQANAAYPNPPAGAIAGGPNSGLQDPVAQQNLPGCAPAKCYIDDIGSWSTNEVAINWNSSLAWVAAYADAD